MSKGTTHRTVRIEGGLWQAAQAKADAEGWNISAAIRDALTGYVGGPSELLADAWDEGFTVGDDITSTGHEKNPYREEGK